MLYSNINGRKRITLVKLPMLYDIGKTGTRVWQARAGLITPFLMVVEQ